MADRLVWIDLEMTGLDSANDVILEIAALVTNGELEPLGDGVDLVVAQPREKLDAMVDVVREMHASSGLTDAVLASTTSLADAEAAVLAHIKEHVPNAKQAPLCGNSIATDRGFLARYMPDLDGYLHYRMVDVSSIKELCRRWYPRTYQEAPAKAGGHRALADILESVAELRYYRSTIFVPPRRSEPPPETATATVGNGETATAASPATGSPVPDVRP
ncbi:MAG: oligoribonuclease [Mycobacteriales bacterium]